MKRIFLFILFLFPIIGNTYSIVVTSKAEWDAYFTSGADLQTFSDGLKFRYEDRVADFRDYSDYPGTSSYDRICTTIENSTDVPDSTFTYSRHYVTPAVDGIISAGLFMDLGPYSARLQPATINYWIKSIFHNADVDGLQYPWSILIGKSAPALYTWPWDDAGNEMAIIGFAHDAHSPYAPGQILYYDGHIGDGSTSVGWRDAYAPANLTWIKYTVEFDWTNKLVRYYINDVLRTSLGPNGGGLQTVTNGWIGMIDAGYFWVGTWGTDGFPTDHLPMTANHVNYFMERLDWNIGTVPYFAATRFIRYKLYTANGILTFDMTPAGGIVYGVKATWTATTETDTNVTSTYGRSLATDATKITASSDAGTGFEATQAIRIDTNGNRVRDKEWKAASTADSWLKYDLVTARVITCIPICVGSFPSIKVEGSNDDSSYTQLMAATAWNSITPHATNQFAKDITFSNSTAYRYYKITFGGSVQARVQGLELREAGDARSAANWTGVSMEYRVSTNSGVDYGSWTALTSGSNLTGASGTASSLRIQLRPTLTTDNQKYQPVISSLTVETTPPPTNISGGKLTGGKTQ